MEVRSTAASDFEVGVHGEDHDRRGIDVAGRRVISGIPVSGNAGALSPMGTTNSHPRKLRAPELPPSGLAPPGTRPEGSVDPDSKSVAATDMFLEDATVT